MCVGRGGAGDGGPRAAGEARGRWGSTGRERGSVPRLVLLFLARWEGGEVITGRPARLAATALTASSSNLENLHIARNPSACSPASEKSKVINI